jgi:hypothetical protein
MDIDKFGILLTIVVVGSVLSIGGITSGEYGFSEMGLKLPEVGNIIPTVNTDTPNAYYKWCSDMGIDCS